MQLKNLLNRRRRNLPPKVKGPGAGVFLRLHGDPLAYLETLRHKRCDVVSFRAAGERIYLVKSPELIHEVLVTKGRQFSKGRSLERARQVFGNGLDRKSTRLNSSHANISYAVFCLTKK